MPLNHGVGEDSRESLGLQGGSTSPSSRGTMHNNNNTVLMITAGIIATLI